ncbi:MAG: TIGR04283 family arsenosugar biosynthesis glycosyltransferase [Candidatus Acidiferrales bacterium]
MDRQGCICVFAKPPEPGIAKTRLVPAVGTKGAAALAKAFLQDIWAAVQCIPWARSVIASTDPLPSPVVGDSAEVWLQGEGDLGSRLERILRRALSESDFAIALGADSPGLPLRFLEQARDAMREADAAIGPCEDGGFYLLALRQCPAGLLAGVTWSDASTFDQLVSRLRGAGLLVSVLDAWFDVDLPEDIPKLRTKIISGEIHALATQRALGRLYGGTAIPDCLKISVVLPVLNERECLPRTIAHVQSQPWVHEIIVIDAGSTDGTRGWIQQQKQGVVLDVPGGKGTQINAGARVATGDVLLFLHADSLLPPHAGEQIQEVLKTEKSAGGCFCVRFADGLPRSLKLVSAGINLRTRLTHTATGDQAIFVRKQAFEKAGGCPDWPLFEDVELVRRIKRQGSFEIVRSAVTVSPRRYLRHGIVKTACLIYALRIAFWAGVSPFALKKWFDDVRSHPSVHTPGS